MVYNNAISLMVFNNTINVGCKKKQKNTTINAKNEYYLRSPKRAVQCIVEFRAILNDCGKRDTRARYEWWKKVRVSRKSGLAERMRYQYIGTVPVEEGGREEERLVWEGEGGGGGGSQDTRPLPSLSYEKNPSGGGGYPPTTTAVWTPSLTSLGRGVFWGPSSIREGGGVGCTLYFILQMFLQTTFTQGGVWFLPKWGPRHAQPPRADSSPRRRALIGRG